MVTRNVALISETTQVSFSQLSRVAAAIQKQATDDLAPLWSVSASVHAFNSLEDKPLGFWPVLLRDNIPYQAEGIHLDKNKRPYALVMVDNDEWSLTVSHETLEMLVDPYGNRLTVGQSPKNTQGNVEFLVEVCDPCEDSSFAYEVNGFTGIKLSDFYTPHYFDPTTTPGTRYSVTGAITQPRQVLKGGYLSWFLPSDNSLWQETYFGTSPEIGQPTGFKGVVKETIRTTVDSLAHADHRMSQHAARKAGTGAKAMAAAAAGDGSARNIAKSLHDDIEKVIAETKQK